MKKNVLIVEDNPAVRVILKCLLIKKTYAAGRVYEAPNGKAALDIIRSHNIDIILTDIDMPVMDGIEMLGHLRAHPELEEIPAVVISSVSDEEVIETLLNSGFGFVPKPILWPLLDDQIKKVEKESYVTYLY